MAASILELKDRNLIERVILFFAPKPVCDQHTVNPGNFSSLNRDQALELLQVKLMIRFSGSDGHLEAGSETRDSHQSLF